MLFRSDRKSTRLNSSHTIISYAVFCLKKKKGVDEHALGAAVGPSAGGPEQPTPVRSFAQFRPSPTTQGMPIPWALSGWAFFFLMKRGPPRSTPFPYTTLFRSNDTATNRDLHSFPTRRLRSRLVAVS